MGKNQVELNDAIKADDWKCTGGINAGQDSYRVYESESTNQRVVEDGKNKSNSLSV